MLIGSTSRGNFSSFWEKREEVNQRPGTKAWCRKKERKGGKWKKKPCEKKRREKGGFSEARGAGVGSAVGTRTTIGAAP